MRAGQGQGQQVGAGRGGPAKGQDRVSRQGWGQQAGGHQAGTGVVEF